MTPIQRIPRYKLLLENYLKQLPDDAVDRKEAETALDLIADAATHSNDTLKTNVINYIESFKYSITLDVDINNDNI